MRIYLTGFMGSGKTTVGARLAAALGCRFVDLDGEIEEAAGLQVREIFARDGEEAFRRLEHDALARTLAEPEVVVATGGGTVTLQTNRDLIGRAGLSVWINPPFAVIASRIGGTGKEDRPLFRDEVQALELYRSRLAAYRSADLRVEVGAAEEPAEVAARIRLLLGRMSGLPR